MASRWGPRRCPQTDSVYSHRLPSAHFAHRQGPVHRIYSHGGRRGMVMTPCSPEERRERKKPFPSKTFFSRRRNHPSFRAAGSRARASPAPAWHLLYSVSALLTYQSIIRCSIPRGAHKLDPIMRRSNDCLCIFGLDFQLYAVILLCWMLRY